MNAPGDSEAVAFEEMQVRVARARKEEATAMLERSQRRRARVMRSLHWLGLRGAAPAPPTLPDTPAPSPRAELGVRAATNAYLGGLGEHNADEDLHPHRLDETESDLADALSRRHLAKLAEERDARDGI